MLIHVLFLILVLFFFLYGIALFVPTVIELLINIPILYAIGVRSYIDIVEEKNIVPYLLGLLVALFLLLVKRALFGTTHYIIWGPTLFLIVAFVSAQIMIQINLLLQRQRH